MCSLDLSFKSCLYILGQTYFCLDIEDCEYGIILNDFEKIGKMDKFVKIGEKLVMSLSKESLNFHSNPDFFSGGREHQRVFS